VFYLHDLQGLPVIRVVVVNVAWVANLDAARHLWFEVIILCAVHAQRPWTSLVSIASAAQKKTMPLHHVLSSEVV
jgi:hypothetical protein